MEQQRKSTKGRSPAAFALWGIIGCGIGAALGVLEKRTAENRRG